MLAALPQPVRLILLIIVGMIVGAFVNWAIYSWTYFLRRPISPWMKPADLAPPRRWLDRIPVLGWLGLKREQAIHGRRFWVRPLLIELVCAIGLPWFYSWQTNGGLTGGTVFPAPAGWTLWTETWFWGHSLLIGLMMIATFIDFDERTIPDRITLPGTLLALILAAGCPWFRLPEVIPNMVGAVVEPIHFASSQPLPGWQAQNIGLVCGLLLFSIWMLALLPKVCTLKYGWLKGIQYMLASVLRPRRKISCSLRLRQRSPFGVTLGLSLTWLIGVGSIYACYRLLPVDNWNSLFGALCGMGFGGGMVWSIRLVARYAMGREAMGFGDVTLMAMIGAFLGWQAALITFAIAPLAAIVVVIINFLITRDNELAFGPYLCVGCLILLFNWVGLWSAASLQFFFMGPLLFLVLLVALVMMAVMLIGIQWFKGLFYEQEPDV